MGIFENIEGIWGTLYFKKIVEDRVKEVNLGGSYKFYKDSSIIAHDYSDDAINLIIKDVFRIVVDIF